MNKLLLTCYMFISTVVAFAQDNKSLVQNSTLPDSLGVYSIVEQMPEYKDGVASLYSFIKRNIVYPQMEKDSGIGGRVFVKFIVNEEGEVVNPHVTKGVSAGLNEEAVRVIQLLKEFKPGKHRGKKVKVYCTVPVTFESVHVFVSNNKEPFLDGKVLTYADQMPEYPGGDAALITHTHRQIVYPQVDRDARIEGKVLVRFVVDETGRVVDPVVVRGVSPGLDAEAVRVIKTLKQFSPAMQNGKPVKVYYNFPIVFKLQR